MSEESPPYGDKPQRAFTLTLVLGADSREDLVQALENLAFDISRGEITRGCWGSPSNGAFYELRTDQDMTHDRYFEAVDRYLSEQARS